MKKTRSLIILLLVLTSLTSFSQKYFFKNLSVADGLSQSEIYAICEDQRGNLWFGSMGGGIIKYDGYSFTSYREEDGLNSNYVNTIFEDNKRTIWIGTSEGISTYDGYIFKNLSDTLLLHNDNIKAIIQDKDGLIWFGTANNGVFKYDGKKIRQVKLPVESSNLQVSCLFNSSDTVIWVGTDQGAFVISWDTCIHYTKRQGLAGNSIRSICQDKTGNIWFATYGNGISSFDGTKFSNYDVYDGLSNNTVYSIFCDNQGNIWCGTGHGVSKYDGKNFKTYRETSGLASNVVVCIIQDATENLWFGTAGGGVSRFNGERFIHYTSNDKLGKGILSVIQATNGNMVFGSSIGGITVFDGTSYTLLKRNNSFTNSRVIALYYSPDSTLWCGTIDDGAFRFKTRGFEHFNPQCGLHSNNISSFATDIAGNIWFASLDSGICVYNQLAEKYIKFNKTSGLESNVVYQLKADNKNNVWIATANGGMHKINIKPNDTIYSDIIHLNKEKGITDKSVKALEIDSLNNVYFGTSGDGIFIYNGSKFYTLNKDNGLCSNNIYLLMFDNAGNLWAGTELGIDKILLDSAFNIKKCIHYGRNEGFTGIEVYRNSYCIDNNNNIWFGTVNGANMYKSSEEEEKHFSPTVYLTNIRLFYENINDTKFADSILPWYPIPHELKLPYRQNNLTFEFSGIYLRNPEAVRYKWILEGFEEEWSPELNQRSVTYSNLSTGIYTFKVKACNEFNEWNSNTVSFTFEILNPLWQRWWFLTSVFLFVLLIIWRIIYLRFKRIKTKNRIAQERLEMEKTIIELEQEAARLQMNPHFIFNSLNSIQGFIATQDTFQAKRYLAKFARLMRLILENAREEYVTIENEVEILENYLELEKLSTNNKFEFSIEIDPSIDKELIEIPPMMIQPFVENAIIHGVKNKSDKGTIQLKFSLDKDLLICEIKDDGVGREKAMEKKKQGHAKHKSTGMSVTKKRLEQLKLQTKLNARIEIEDLKDKNGQPIGTKVNIFIPYESY